MQTSESRVGSGSGRWKTEPEPWRFGRRSWRWVPRGISVERAPEGRPPLCCAGIDRAVANLLLIWMQKLRVGQCWFCTHLTARAPPQSYLDELPTPWLRPRLLNARTALETEDAPATQARDLRHHAAAAESLLSPEGRPTTPRLQPPGGAVGHTGPPGGFLRVGDFLCTLLVDKRCSLLETLLP